MKAPPTAIAPPKTHAPRMSVGVCTCRATTYGFMKMPEPTMPPITTMTASNRPNWQAKRGLASLTRAALQFSVTLRVYHKGHSGIQRNSRIAHSASWVRGACDGNASSRNRKPGSKGLDIARALGILCCLVTVLAAELFACKWLGRASSRVTLEALLAIEAVASPGGWAGPLRLGKRSAEAI
jgi:hypothetical protein